MSNKSFVWWHQIPGPSTLLKKITDYLCEEKSCALFFMDDIPWYDVFSDIIENQLRTFNSENEIEIIDVTGIPCSTSDEAGEYIAQKYCTRDKLADHWPGESYAEFLAHNDDIVLNNKYIWLKGLDADNYITWYDFVNDYVRAYNGNQKRASFFLECSLECQQERTKNVKIIEWEDEVHKYDYYMFCSVLVSDLKCSDELKRYISDLAYNLSDFHAEFAAEFLEYGMKIAENPQNILQKCINNYNAQKNEKIILSSVYNLDSVVLEAQIKNIFPAIERFRRRFVTNYYHDIKELLPIRNTIMDEEINDPYGCEINILRKFTDKKEIRASAEDIKLVRLMHETRNFIAHNRTVEYKNIEILLGK